MKRKTKKEPKAPEVIKGDDHGKDVFEQTREARGIEDKEPDLAGKAGSEESRPPRTPEMVARDAQIEERIEHLEENGTNPNEGGAGMKKVELADTSKKQYIGMVTVTGIHNQTHEKISARIDLPVESGEDYVHYCFFVHHPAAMRDPDTITIDAENKDDPMLRSRWE